MWLAFVIGVVTGCAVGMLALGLLRMRSECGFDCDLCPMATDEEDES